MCGIYGTTRIYSRETIKRKLDRMNFRGPDHQDSKEYKISDGKVLTLGHVRLSIIDLDARSNQPFDYNERISVVFNGEIYNYKDLIAQLLDGREMHTSSDTEVLCAMYEKYGVDCLKYMNGMFAFVIYDREKNILMGARDRLGKKPFYYRNADGELEFASQISVIAEENDFEIDEDARKMYFFGNYIPDPYSIYKGVKRLRAGQYFVYDLGKKDMKIEQYWNLFSNTCGYEAPKSFEEAKENLTALLQDAVKIRLNADVPVGIFLSGGIDSSLTAALVSKINPQLACYSIGFRDKDFDESPHAKAVAGALGVPFKLNYCEGDEMLSMFENYTRYFDEPFADDSLIPSSLVAMKARKDVTVVLGGDGGDELFLGYDKYQKFAKLRTIYKMSLPLRMMAHGVGSIMGKGNRTRVLKYTDVNDAILATNNVHNYYGAERYDALEVARMIPDREFINEDRGLLMYSDFDMKHYLNSNGNTKTDRSSMRFSLELRSPLMDYRVAEYSRLLPQEYLLDKDMGGKRILKSILYDMVPREILDRPKMGFSSPVVGWLRNELKDMFVDIVTKENVEVHIPELDADRIIELRDMFLRGDRRKFYNMWVIFNYLNWALMA